MLHSSYRRISQIQSDIQQGKISCEALVQSYLQSIEANKHLNALLEVYGDEALGKARELDAKVKSGAKCGKLYGLIIVLKDNICYKGHKASAGSKILGNFVSLYNSTVAERLLAEDAIIIGRTNCDEFAMGSSNENSAYGNVLNAIDNSRVPGGSSGGSAVAVQAGMCHAALGSDTGGSIRQPAAFCGVLGMKPTYTDVFRVMALIAYASSFDQIGPFTNSVEDMALITEVISGKDNYDSTSSSMPVPSYSTNLKYEKKARIAIFPSVMKTEGIQTEVIQAFDKTVEKLKADGHTIGEVEFDFLDLPDRRLLCAYYCRSLIRIWRALMASTTAIAPKILPKRKKINWNRSTKNHAPKVLAKR